MVLIAILEIDAKAYLLSKSPLRKGRPTVFMKWYGNRGGIKPNFRDVKMVQFTKSLLCKHKVWLSKFSERWS